MRKLSYVATLIASFSFVSLARSQPSPVLDFKVSNCRFRSDAVFSRYGYTKLTDGREGVDRESCIASQLSMILHSMVGSGDSAMTTADQGYVEFRSIGASEDERCPYKVESGVPVPPDLIEYVSGRYRISTEDADQFNRQRDALNGRLEKIIHINCLLF